MNRLLQACLLGSLLLLSGCGTGEFHNRMQAGISKLQTQAKASGLLPAAAVASSDGQPTSVTVQLPAFCAGSQSINAATAGAQIPGVTVPGYFYSLQFNLTDGAGKTTPAYCEYYILPRAGVALADVKTQLQTALASALPNATWEDRQFGAAPGAKLTAAADLEFEVAGAKETLPAQVELYVVEAPNHFVALGWRAAQAAATQQGFFAQVQAAMNTMTVTAPAPP